ncbi:MAG: carbamoyl phosphate synthase small subunit [Acetivibrionales bacterium]|jgi:carbamoyl-phosphate synthase small subunit
MVAAILALEDGTVFHGSSFGTDGEVIGEIVFNTGMTGYQEILTDPSNFGQIVTMTYPLIGNCGVNQDDFESNKPYIRGFIVRELCKAPSNWRSKEPLNEYLKRHGIIGIEGIDTRALTRILREKGAMRGIISTDADFRLKDKINEIKAYSIKDLVSQVTTRSVIHYKGEGCKVALIDFGMNKSIIRSLLNRNCDVFIFPSNVSEEVLLNINPDGIVLSNGPGNPKDCLEAVGVLKKIMNKKPVFGICLGHQLMALANGADTKRLKYGHRGSNHPVKDINKGLTYITTQNHGYTVVEESLDRNRMEVTHINMNDGTIEGIKYKDVPVFTVQFYPEASPGPADTAYLFDEFIKMMEEC